MTAKEQFLKGFDEENASVIRVFIHIPGCPSPEMIENPKENFPFKKAYYEDAYDESLHLKANRDIFIVGAEIVTATADGVYRLEPQKAES